ncbi:MAG: serine hydrolase, partial [Eubacteriales bacterium]
MNITYATPESRGISSADIDRYVRHLEAHHLAMHDILIARGNTIVSEIYYPPFTADFSHRLYSVTKSFVALAVGFALEDGLLSLDDPMSAYFSKELSAQGDENEKP